MNSITHRDRTYLSSVRAPRDARPDAAADQAAHDVLTALYPNLRGELGSVLHAELARIPAATAGLTVPRWARPWPGTCSSSGPATDPRPPRRRS